MRRRCTWPSRHHGRVSLDPGSLVSVLSSFWRTKAHPDPDGETLELVIAYLEEQWRTFREKGIIDVGLIVDWSALWQEPRTPEQDVAFMAQLRGINQW